MSRLNASPLRIQAHYISNHQSNTCKAICSLEAEARWAVTGTPLQNKLGDVATLCQFLRVHPYGNRDRFNKDIIDPWKAGDNNTAVSRLKHLLQCILLRRSKGSVQLPERTDLRLMLQLSEEERQHYATAESNVAKSIDVALGANTNAASKVTSIIQQINELRLICNLGIYRKPPNPVPPVDNTTWNTRGAQAALNALTATDSICCNSCGEIQDGNKFDNSFGANLCLTRLWLFSCSSIACETCMARNPSTRCSCVRQCPVAFVTHAPGMMDSRAPSPVKRPFGSEEVLPTKVNALVTDLLKQKSGTKRSALSSVVLNLPCGNRPALIHVAR
jgi:SWI/SNF-related matrix-associated actin-dependent regulator of chromatin subfamily A3